MTPMTPIFLSTVFAAATRALRGVVGRRNLLGFKTILTHADPHNRRAPAGGKQFV